MCGFSGSYSWKLTLFIKTFLLYLWKVDIFGTVTNTILYILIVWECKRDSTKTYLTIFFPILVLLVSERFKISVANSGHGCRVLLWGPFSLLPGYCLPVKDNTDYLSKWSTMVLNLKRIWLAFVKNVQKIVIYNKIHIFK